MSCAAIFALHSIALAGDAQYTHKGENAEELKVWLGEFTPSLQQYNKALISEVLERNQAHYLNTNVVYSTRKMHTKRWRLEASKGINLHLFFSADWEGMEHSISGVRNVVQPFLKHRLGLRKCITHASREKALNDVNRYRKLKKIHLGQVHSWPDIAPYKKHGITVVEADNYQSMFSMLSHGRFDCLPLSVLEIDGALQEQLEIHPQLVINDELFLFYPLPYYLGITEARSGLADMFESTLSHMAQEGSLNKLYADHFSHTEKDFYNSSGYVFILSNPIISKNLNAQLARQFIDNLPSQHRLKIVDLSEK